MGQAVDSMGRSTCLDRDTDRVDSLVGQRMEPGDDSSTDSL